VRPFRFRLERARQWQQEVCNAEEENLRSALHDMAQSERRLQLARAEAAASEEEARRQPTMAAGEICAWAAARHIAVRTERELVRERSLSQATVNARREVLAAARRRLEMLDMIRDRDLRIFQAEESRELETVAQESYSNRLHRQRTSEGVT
jgi:hypothetical protein